MKKFSKLNESYVDDNIMVTVGVTIYPELSNAIIEEVLKVYPNKRVLESYGHDKIVNKIVAEYLNRYVIYNHDDLKFNILSMGNDWIEKTLWGDLKIDPDDMRNTLLRMNGRDPNIDQ
tara:strand:- start:2192 stop:2545 length:354 start_codon:yes stop_codon:yes gene_type:complete